MQNTSISLSNPENALRFQLSIYTYPSYQLLNITCLNFTPAIILICKNIQKPQISIAYLSIFLRLVSFLVANLMSTPGNGLD